MIDDAPDEAPDVVRNFLAFKQLIDELPPLTDAERQDYVRSNMAHFMRLVESDYAGKLAAEAREPNNRCDIESVIASKIDVLALAKEGFFIKFAFYMDRLKGSELLGVLKPDITPMQLLATVDLAQVQKQRSALISAMKGNVASAKHAYLRERAVKEWKANNGTESGAHFARKFLKRIAREESDVLNRIAAVNLQIEAAPPNKKELAALRAQRRDLRAQAKRIHIRQTDNTAATVVRWLKIASTGKGAKNL